MKKFDRVAKTIRKVNDGLIANHSAAAADFLDVEFSNNTGRARRAWASQAIGLEKGAPQAGLLSSDQNHGGEVSTFILHLLCHIEILTTTS